MAIHCNDREIRGDRSGVRAVSVGDLRWVFGVHLRGRTFTMLQAVGIVRVAEALSAEGRYGSDDPVWWEIFDWLQPAGMTVLDVVGMLELSYPVEDVPVIAAVGTRPVRCAEVSRATRILRALGQGSRGGTRRTSADSR